MAALVTKREFTLSVTAEELDFLRRGLKALGTYGEWKTDEEATAISRLRDELEE